VQYLYSIMNNEKESSLPPPKRLKTGPTTSSSAGEDPSLESSIAIRPTQVTHTGNWKVCQDGNIIYRTTPTPTPTLAPISSLKVADGSIAVAGFDLGGTLLASQKQFPHTLADYELWNQNVIDKLRTASDDGYLLAIFINQGGIRGAVNGKTASKVKDLIEWLSSSAAIDRPIIAFLSTQKKSGFHKPSPDMWNTAQQILGFSFDQASSFFVGDGVDYEKDGKLILGDDESFARNVSGVGSVQFFTPTAYFGPSHLEAQREKRVTAQQLAYEIPPKTALETRAALQSGYLKTKGILLLLCGGQGSGKSFFCHELTKGDANNHNHNGNHNDNGWVHLSQDTIRNGKPGSREAVERAARQALAEQKHVIVDRMHLDATQRSHFVQLAKDAKVPVHIVALTTPKAVVTERVLTRENHAGNVEGESGARLASASWSNLVMPKYEEGFDLISATGTPEGVQSIVHLYRRVGTGSEGVPVPAVAYKSSVQDSYPLPGSISIPSIALGTYKLGKKTATNIVSLATELGIRAIDTAPTYKNEQEVSTGMRKDTFCIAKIPKRATTAKQVRHELESTLTKFNRKKVDLLFLHWPCDVITSDTLQEVWLAMEKCVKDGLANALGVCNFNIEALRLLLPHCTAVRPIVNQVERHVQLPQWELVDFCAQQDILLQAHSPLGQGKLLDHDTVKEVAARSGLSRAQVLLQWNLHQQIAVVTKCSSREHLLDVVGTTKTGKVLSAQDLMALNEIGETKRFVSPPFMFGNEPFCWGKSVPK
jgi:DNA 3'-phosphatase